jgi:hypothetical protein
VSTIAPASAPFVPMPSPRDISWIAIKATVIMDIFLEIRLNIFSFFVLSARAG